MSSTVVNLNFTVLGVLTDLTSADVSNSAATIGIRRTDTLASVVAAGTAFTHVSTGRYQLSFTDPAFGLTYEVWKHFVFEGDDYYQQEYVTGPTAPGYAVADLRTLARQFCRNAADATMYSDAQIDVALMLAGEEWVRIVKPVKALTAGTLTPGSNVLPALPSDWLPEYQMKQNISLAGAIVNPNFTFTTYEKVLQAISDSGGTQPGPPRLMGYENTSSGICFPTPDAAYVVAVWYWQRFPIWTPGGTQSSFPLPDEDLRIIATDGAQAFLQVAEPQHAGLCERSLARFKEKAWRIKGRNHGGRDGNVWIKDDPDVPARLITAG